MHLWHVLSSIDNSVQLLVIAWMPTSKCLARQEGINSLKIGDVVSPHQLDMLKALSLLIKNGVGSCVNIMNTHVADGMYICRGWWCLCYV